MNHCLLSLEAYLLLFLNLLIGIRCSSFGVSAPLLLPLDEELIGMDLIDLGSESFQTSLGDVPLSLPHAVLVHILCLHLE